MEVLKPCMGKEAQARMSAVIGRREKESENTTCRVCERDRHSRLHRKNGYRSNTARASIDSFAPLYQYWALGSIGLLQTRFFCFFLRVVR